jgi:hypothetical protein
MIDIAQWIKRAVDFAERCRALPGEVQVRISVSPPAPAKLVDKTSRRLRLGLPPPLARFFLEGAQELTSFYIVDNYHERFSAIYPHKNASGSLFGGVDDWGLASCERFQQDAEDTVAGFDYSPSPKDANDRRLWNNSVLFEPVGNGDYLGLDVSASAHNPPVVYLAHDGGGDSCEISPSFDEFLEAWEEICYVGPGFFAPFFQEKTQMLTKPIPNAAAIKACFEVSSRDSRR